MVFFVSCYLILTYKTIEINTLSIPLLVVLNMLWASKLGFFSLAVF